MARRFESGATLLDVPPPRAEFISPGGVRVLVSDSFNRADSALTLGNADTGQAWSVLSGTWGVNSNTAYKVATDDVDQAVVVETGRSDVSVTTTIATMPDVNGAGLVLRATDNSNYLLAICILTVSEIRLYSQVAGSFTLLATGSWTSPANGDVLKAVLNGTSINILLNGVSKITYSTSVQQTATKHGLYLRRLTPRLDNFLVTAP